MPSEAALELPAAIPGDVVDDLVLAVREAATNAILYGSCDAQPVKMTSGCRAAGSRRRSATGAAPSRAAPVMSLRGRGLWLIGQLVDELRLAKARPGTLVTLRRCIGDSAAIGELSRWPGGRQRVPATTTLADHKKAWPD